MASALPQVRVGAEAGADPWRRRAQAEDGSTPDVHAIARLTLDEGGSDAEYPGPDTASVIYERLLSSTRLHSYLLTGLFDRQNHGQLINQLPPAAERFPGCHLMRPQTESHALGVGDNV